MQHGGKSQGQPQGQPQYLGYQQVPSMMASAPVYAGLIAAPGMMFPAYASFPGPMPADGLRAYAGFAPVGLPQDMDSAAALTERLNELHLGGMQGGPRGRGMPPSGPVPYGGGRGGVASPSSGGYYNYPAALQPGGPPGGVLQPHQQLQHQLQHQQLQHQLQQHQHHQQLQHQQHQQQHQQQGGGRTSHPGGSGASSRAGGGGGGAGRGRAQGQGGGGGRGQQPKKAKRSQKGMEDNVKRTVYISYVDHQVTEEMLAAFFQECGRVMDCRICGDPNSAMRFAFIEFSELESAQKALEKSGSVLGGSPLRVLPSKTAIMPVNRELMPTSSDDIERCSRTVYAANIDKKVDRNDVRAFFESLCGKVSRIRLLGDYAHATRIAFVEFIEAEGALAALNCSGALLGSLPIRVSPSKTPVKVDSKEDGNANGNANGNAVAAPQAQAQAAAPPPAAERPAPPPPMPQPPVPVPISMPHQAPDVAAALEPVAA